MSDYKLPELPSDDELGIDDDDLEEFLEEEGSELTDQEREALLGESPGREGTSGAAAPAGSGAKPGPTGPSAPPGRSEPSAQSSSSQPSEQPKAKKAKRSWWGRKKKAEETESEAPTPERRPAPEAPRTRWRGPVTLALLVLGAWFGSSARVVPRPVAANAADTVFSSARAMSHIVEIARAAHPPGSPEHDRVRTYIMGELRALGLEPEVQTATSMIRGGATVRAATTRNIVARLAGTASTGALLVTAHYDGRELARAAGDDGSGVVSILESIRALRAGEPLRNDLIVLITDAEELGLLGARAFVDEHPWMDDVRAVISVEMRGAAGPSIMFETGAEYGWVLKAYADGAPRPFANSLTYEIYKTMPNDTDFTPFREAGAQGLNFAAVGRAHVYHQVYDDPENLHEGTLQHHGLNTLSMLKQLGNADLSSVNAPDVVYFTAPLVGFVVYAEGWVWPLTALVVLLWVGLGYLARKRGLSVWGAAAGAATAVVSTAALYGAGLWLSGWLGGFHPEQGALQGSAFHSEGWYVLAVAALATVVVTGLWSLARSRFGVPELAVGVGGFLVVLVVAVTWVVPLGAMNLQWPAVAFLVAAAATLLPAVGLLREVRWGLTLAAALVVPLMLTSVAELLWLALSISMAPALGAFLVLMLLLMLPALDALREPNAWWAPVSAVVFGAAFLGLGILQAEPSPERPLPSTLIYTLDRETGVALWATQPSLGAEDPARAWAEAQAAVSFTQSTSLDPFGQRAPAYAVAPAPTREAPAPTVLLDSVAGLGSSISARIRVRSAIGAELLLFLLPEDGPELVRVNGKALPTLQRDGQPATVVPTRIEHWGRPDSMVTLHLVVPATHPLLSFDVVEHSFRPGELVGAEVFQRPPGLAANIVRASDRAMIRMPVALVLSPAGVVGAPSAQTPTGPPAAPDTAARDTTGLTPGRDTTAVDTVPRPDTTAVDTVPRPDTTAADTVPTLLSTGQDALPVPNTVGR